jgi:hypothetical protein
LEADKGYSRLELRELIHAEPRFRDQMERNVNAFYNNVIRYLRGGKIVEIDGLLYHPDRAPLPEGEPDPSGEHLPANVSLFPDRRNEGGAK